MEGFRAFQHNLESAVSFGASVHVESLEEYIKGFAVGEWVKIKME